MMYNELVEQYFFNPKHVGIVDLSQPFTVSYRNGDQGRGDIIELSIHCDSQGLVINAFFKAYGNPYLIAAAEWLCRFLERSKIDEQPQFDYMMLIQILAIPKTRYSIALQIEDSYREVILKMKKLLSGETND